MTKSREFHLLDPRHADPARLKRERAKARDLKATRWWKEKIAAGLCHYCGKKFLPKDLTMDHIVPIARGGESVKGNVAPACRPCNQEKHLENPVDALFEQLEKERKSRGGAD
jgi:5-methylcytosine-specific restriction enzyme A